MEHITTLVDISNTIEHARPKNENFLVAFANKILAILKMAEAYDRTGVLNKLKHNILPQVDESQSSSGPDEDDWMIDCKIRTTFYHGTLELIQ